MAPVISVVLATRDRPAFLSLALQYYAWQTQRETELIVVDDSSSPAATPANQAIRRLALGSTTSLGTKLNLGVEQARGRFILKMDDDDYYAPHFLGTMLAACVERPRSAIAFLQPFLFLDLLTLTVRCADAGRCSGATLFFERALWEQVPFRDTSTAVDAEFLLDHGADARRDSTFTRVHALESFLQVRHGSHTWTHMPWGESVETYVARLPLHDKQLDDLVPPWVAARYRELATNGR
jgi:glycosyltransferase involved in cell wall biosynthesis